MLCLGPKKSLSSLWLKLTAQGMVQHTDVQRQVRYRSAIQTLQNTSELTTMKALRTLKRYLR